MNTKVSLFIGNWKFSSFLYLLYLFLSFDLFIMAFLNDLHESTVVIATFFLFNRPWFKRLLAPIKNSFRITFGYNFSEYGCNFMKIRQVIFKGAWSHEKQFFVD